MRKYYFIIASIVFLVLGLISCSNEEAKTQTPTASRPSTPILDKTITDIDGNVYRIVKIGTQRWAKNNLNVSKYSEEHPFLK